MTIEEQRKLSMEKAERLEEREFTQEEEEYYEKLAEEAVAILKKENGIN